MTLSEREYIGVHMLLPSTVLAVGGYVMLVPAGLWWERDSCCVGAWPKPSEVTPMSDDARKVAEGIAELDFREDDVALADAIEAAIKAAVLARVPRCDSCRFWDVTSMPSYLSDGAAKCQKHSTSPQNGGSGVFVLEEGTATELHTLPNFGCVQHEPRDVGA